MLMRVCGCLRLHDMRKQTVPNGCQVRYGLTADEFRVVIEKDRCREERNEGDK